mmetsp:Transcript_37355/g.72973  ORF Transcript_37355/g.72973 Transcript_37355/m.72973 type:complete len:214 (+) Transcript_37355:1515-2156(+)
MGDLGGVCREQARRAGLARGQQQLRSGDNRCSHGSLGSLQGRERGLVRHPAVAGSQAYPAVSEICRVPQGRRTVVPPRAQLLHLPPIHVPPPPLPVSPRLWVLARRDSLLPHLPPYRERDQQHADDPTIAAVILVPRPPRAGAAGRVVDLARQDPAPRHLLQCRGVPRRDNRGVEAPELPREARVRVLQAAARGAPGGGQDSDEGSLPVPEVR